MPTRERLDEFVAAVVDGRFAAAAAALLELPQTGTAGLSASPAGADAASRAFDRDPFHA